MKVKTLRNWHFITLFNKVGEIVGEISWARFKEVFFAQAISEIGVVNTCPKQGTMTLEYAATYPVGTIFTFDTSDGDKVLTLDEEVTIVGLKAKLEAMALDVEWTTSTDGFTNANYIYYKSNTLEITGVSVTTPNIGYGRLYNWYAATDTRGLTPIGWHVPTDLEYTTLATFLGGENLAINKLKEVGLVHWAVGNNGNNTSGFKGFGAGVYNQSVDEFQDLKYANYLATSSGNLRYLNFNDSIDFIQIVGTPKNGITVRCIKDDNTPSVGVITDIDGNVYTEVVIGTQIWMVENLKTKHYRNGDAIGSDFTGTTGAVCAYNNDENNV